jgi:hypothetical protein
LAAIAAKDRREQITHNRGGQHAGCDDVQSQAYFGEQIAA